MKEWGRVNEVLAAVSCRGGCDRARAVGAMIVAVVSWLLGTRPCVAGCSHQGTRRAGEVRGVGRLGCRGMYSRRVTRMMGSLATAKLGSISSPTATRGVGSCRSSSSQLGRVRASRGCLFDRREASDLAVA
jgi:hypothetical protein